MRDIKFRGKRTDNDKWIYGGVLTPTELYSEYEISDCESIDGSRYEVDEDTIGQYTGLHDKNGKEIYEGDIVKYDAYWEGDFDFPAGAGPIIWDNEEAQFLLKNEYGNNPFIEMFNLTKNLNAEIIGNIYDNPELLK